jgi:hypothetical protein
MATFAASLALITVSASVSSAITEMPDPACQVNERYVGIEWPVLPVPGDGGKARLIRTVW